MKGIADPAVSPLLVVALAKVRAEKQKFDREKKQKAKSKSPTVPSQPKKAATFPAVSSHSKEDAGSVIKKRGIRRRSRRKGTMGRGRRGVISNLMRMRMMMKC